MFKRKYPALLFSPDSAVYPEVSRVSFTIEGLQRRRLAPHAGDRVLVLNDDGTVTGSSLYGRWEPLS